MTNSDLSLEDQIRNLFYDAVEEYKSILGDFNQQVTDNNMDLFCQRVEMTLGSKIKHLASSHHELDGLKFGVDYSRNCRECYSYYDGKRRNPRYIYTGQCLLFITNPESLVMTIEKGLA